jgi:hypothetical protein
VFPTSGAVDGPASLISTSSSDEELVKTRADRRKSADNGRVGAGSTSRWGKEAGLS